MKVRIRKSKAHELMEIAAIVLDAFVDETNKHISNLEKSSECSHQKFCNDYINRANNNIPFVVPCVSHRFHTFLTRLYDQALVVVRNMTKHFLFASKPILGEYEPVFKRSKYPIDASLVRMLSPIGVGV